ncbi:hypothetical protein VTN49DRAFT_1783 [Thermomyces lanuginosus]|uniref:uncharacterized protein n=1 Tax=Thermomyces lanuginosus TaxID=5541 RepID=UPI003743DDC7
MADKLRTLQNLEALQARYVGTGHADTTKYEWTSNIVRDSYASYIGHPPRWFEESETRQSHKNNVAVKHAHCHQVTVHFPRPPIVSGEATGKRSVWLCQCKANQIDRPLTYITHVSST